jgi:leucyl aminopeptidase
LPTQENSRYVAPILRPSTGPTHTFFQDIAPNMTDLAAISFVKNPRRPAGTVVVFAGNDLALGKMAAVLGIGDLLRKAAATAEFKGKPRTTLDLLVPQGTDLDRLVVVGTGKSAEMTQSDWARLGGVVVAALGTTKKATVLFERPDGEAAGAAAADFALGAKLRAYTFDNYRPDTEDAPKRKAPTDIAIAVEDVAAAKAAWAARGAVADGVLLARDLINEPANVLGPVEFADRAKALKDLGVDVEVLTETQMKKLGMRALLGVAQGSARPPRLVVMNWKGGKAKEAPVAFVGKGVVFDTGGISIKPAGGMEDMKGDMGGAAAVTGLMHALAARKARVNAIGVIGIVENMPDGAAQRPGDIVAAMTGRTIEIINTDAEGRLVLADAIAYTEERFKPKFIIDLATLTGAIIVALGHQQAGMFSSDDALAEALSKAGTATGELVWRMPLSADYDRLIDSKFADVKNAGGRDAGAITAAHFIKRFVKKTPWVHLDIAGTALGSPQTDINRSWSSGWGVRLLDRLVADNYES